MATNLAEPLNVCKIDSSSRRTANEQVGEPLDCSGEQAVACGTDQSKARESFFVRESAQEPRTGQDDRGDESSPVDETRGDGAHRILTEMNAFEAY